MLANVTIVTILQYMNVSNQRVVHLKVTQCYLSLHLNKVTGIEKKNWNKTQAT